MPKNNGWFRVYDRMIDSPQVVELEAEEFRLLITMWSLASAAGDGGRVPYSTRVIERKSPCEDVATSLRHLCDLDLLREEDGFFVVQRWDDHQYDYPSKTPYARREQKKKERAREVSPEKGNDVASMSPEKLPLEKTRLDKTRSTQPKSFPTGRMLPADFLSAIAELPRSLSAADFHNAVEQSLFGLGYQVSREYAVPDRGDGMRGRIDLYAVREDGVLALELDNKSPRQKSVFKLNQIENATRVILIRDPGPVVDPPAGIDALIPAGGWSDCPGNLASEDHPKSKPHIDSTASLFPAIWQIYPRRENKQGALKAWAKLRPDDTLQAEILARIRLLIDCPAWTSARYSADGRDTVPHLASWLNARRWEDDPPSTAGCSTRPADTGAAPAPRARYVKLPGDAGLLEVTQEDLTDEAAIARWKESQERQRATPPRGSPPRISLSHVMTQATDARTTATGTMVTGEPNGSAYSTAGSQSRNVRSGSDDALSTGH